MNESRFDALARVAAAQDSIVNDFAAMAAFFAGAGQTIPPNKEDNEDSRPRLPDPSPPPPRKPAPPGFPFDRGVPGDDSDFYSR